ncbi:Ceramidase [Purpureocillium takamizusanense]|uniref:Neutral ceramidase n=1 Tax=Purpureocillium takamizusanense TaxID=2060973 RepID=A0A9Q8VCG9_9HYPO|nr:Ceramidase [Purpureocillium takamizusanense]UNI20703.1 Ceramidase [Purpureocillium takamizusanense]
MAPRRDEPKASNHWPQPSAQRAIGEDPQRRRSRTHLRRHLAVIVVLLCAFVLAYFRAPAWTGAPLLSSDPSLHSVWHNVSDDAHTNVWASDALPAGDWPEDQYLLGVGKADITGPVVELNMMGYADFGQIGSGLRQRLYSRAFIVGDLHNPSDRFVYLVLDVQSGDTAVRYGIIRGLQALGPRYSMYGHDNVAVSATHSHSGPGAWLNYLLPQITSKGFDRQSYRAIVEGCILSIRRAHESLGPGSLSFGKTKIPNAGINRSLYAYLANPAEERARYNISAGDDGSVEMDMTALKFQRTSDGKNIGVLTWFPTHGTSMQANNTLITGDNKGVAADMLEKAVHGGNMESDDFVAGFSQANMGDVSPNVLGAWCEDGSGQRCSFEDSTCGDGRCNMCRAKGPGTEQDDHGASSCLEIGKRQYEGALRLYEFLNAEEPIHVRGKGVKAFHEFHDMSDFHFALPNGSTVRTCAAALGYSFGAGTWDEPGGYDIVQHLSTKSKSSFIWRVVTWLLRAPGQDQIACQAPKHILLDVGEVMRPYEWTPNVVDVQTFRVGQLFIIVSPGEATTMAGRRWKEAVAKHGARILADDLGDREPLVVLGGPSNSYTHYITTEEEYGVQRYEGSSTLYGPHTLAAYIDRTVSSLEHLRSRNAPTRNSAASLVLPPDNSNRSFSFIPGVLYDRTPRGLAFGDVVSDVNVSRLRFTHSETAQAVFVGANPRNNLRLEDTYAAVEYRSSPRNNWKRVRDDSDWDLTFHWRRTSNLRGTSEVTIAWRIEPWAPPGDYRLRYYGDFKSITGRITSFDGASRAFRVS